MISGENPARLNDEGASAVWGVAAGAARSPVAESDAPKVSANYIHKAWTFLFCALATFWMVIGAAVYRWLA